MIHYFSDGATSCYRNKEKKKVNLCHHGLDFVLKGMRNIFRISHAKSPVMRLEVGKSNYMWQRDFDTSERMLIVLHFSATSETVLRKRCKTLLQLPGHGLHTALSMLIQAI
jgi:hypothetical protein